jgi:DeoR family suf operon transcriptional repressor
MFATSSLPGYRGLRADLLIALKKVRTATAKELAEQFGVTPNALRRHLKELEGEGMVRYQREVRGVGGPVFAYSLTERGEALFPRAYDEALSRVLETVREQQGADGVVALFRQQWDAIVGAAKPELEKLPLPERAQLLAELLSSQGYMAEADAQSTDAATIREHNCVLRSVAERFPEVCAAEARFLEEMLDATVKRRAHIASGASCCEYCIQKKA